MTPRTGIIPEPSSTPLPPNVVVSSGKNYFIVNKRLGSACDLSGQDQKSVIGSTFNGGESQRWTTQHTTNGWRIQTFSNKKYLDIDGPLQSGTKLVTIETTEPRTWDICPSQEDGDTYSISVHDSDFDVELSGDGDTQPNTPVIVWSKREPAKKQVWQFKDV